MPVYVVDCVICVIVGGRPSDALRRCEKTFFHSGGARQLKIAWLDVDGLIWQSCPFAIERVITSWEPSHQWTGIRGLESLTVNLYRFSETSQKRFFLSSALIGVNTP